MKKKNLNIQLRGAYNIYNFGDDLLFFAIVNFLNRYGIEKKYKPNFFIHQGFNSVGKLDNKANYNYLIDLQQILNPISERMKKANIPKLLRKIYLGFIVMSVFLNAIVFRLFKITLPSYRQFFQHVEELNIIHFIGGGYLSNKWPHRVYFEYLNITLMKLINPKIKVIGTGLGIGPFNNGILYSVFKRFIKKFNYISVREQESFNYIQSVNVKDKIELNADDVYLLLPELQKYMGKDKDSIAINLKSFSDHNYTEFYDLLNDFISANKNEKTILLPFGMEPGPNDEKHAQDLLLMNKNLEVDLNIYNPYKIGLYEFFEQFSKIKFGIGFAYHFSILASIFSFSTASIYSGNYYKQKIGGAMNLINLEGAVYSIEELLNKDMELNGIYNKKQKYPADVQNNVVMISKDLFDNYAKAYDRNI